jgi:large subunit ribosomal protein L1
MKRSKSYRQALSRLDRSELYAPLAGMRLARETSVTSFDSTVEVAFRLGVDPRKSDQVVRGNVTLPHGTGKILRVLVFATGERAAAAEAAGADFVGSDDLIERIQGGWTDFDAVVASQDLIGKVARLGKILGPKGLMPSPARGTVTTDPARAVAEVKGGRVSFRVDKHANLNLAIGKASFSEIALVQNYAAVLDEVIRLKPSAAKGRYLRGISVSTTMGPGIKLDPARTRNLDTEDEQA